MSLVKKILTLAIVAIVVVVGIVCYIKFIKKDNLQMTFVSQSLDEIKKISEFCTANYYDEIMVIDSIEGRFYGYNKIVMTVKGQIRAGFDLSKMKTEIVEDTLNILLSPACILDTITNPSGFKTISESGSWSHQRVTETKNKARNELVSHAISEGVLSVAEGNGIRLLTAMFSAFGFKYVNINLEK